MTVDSYASMVVTQLLPGVYIFGGHFGTLSLASRCTSIIAALQFVLEYNIVRCRTVYTLEAHR